MISILNHLKTPVAIESLDERLVAKILPRGKTMLGPAGEAIDNIAANYQDMYWWISERGLNMCRVPPAAAWLSEFDRLAGRLYVEGSKDGRLSKELLASIAMQLDAVGFSITDHLQPAQLTPISKFNQRNSRRPIRTFRTVCDRPRLVRSIRRRLYVARDRYTRAHGTPCAPPDLS